MSWATCLPSLLPMWRVSLWAGARDFAEWLPDRGVVRDTLVNLDFAEWIVCVLSERKGLGANQTKVLALHPIKANSSTKRAIRLRMCGSSSTKVQRAPEILSPHDTSTKRRSVRGRNGKGPVMYLPHLIQFNGASACSGKKAGFWFQVNQVQKVQMSIISKK